MSAPAPANVDKPSVITPASFPGGSLSLVPRGTTLDDVWDFFNNHVAVDDKVDQNNQRTSLIFEQEGTSDKLMRDSQHEHDTTAVAAGLDHNSRGAAAAREKIGVTYGDLSPFVTSESPRLYEPTARVFDRKTDLRLPCTHADVVQTRAATAEAERLRVKLRSSDVSAG